MRKETNVDTTVKDMLWRYIDENQKNHKELSDKYTQLERFVQRDSAKLDDLEQRLGVIEQKIEIIDQKIDSIIGMLKPKA
jgi:TRAP-type mannitol/chloroaromatic compound transport system substrate-binding protein